MKKFWHSGHLNISARESADSLDMAHQRLDEDAAVFGGGAVNLAYLPEAVRHGGLQLEAISEVSEEWEEVSSEDLEQRAYYNRGFRVSPVMEFTTEHEIAELSPVAHRKLDLKETAGAMAASAKVEKREEEGMTGSRLQKEEEQSAMTVEVTGSRLQHEEQPATTEKVAGSREEPLATAAENKLDKLSELREKLPHALTEKTIDKETASRLRDELRRAMMTEAGEDRCRDVGCPYNLWLFRDQGYPSREAVLLWEQSRQRTEAGQPNKTR